MYEKLVGAGSYFNHNDTNYAVEVQYHHEGKEKGLAGLPLILRWSLERQCLEDMHWRCSVEQKDNWGFVKEVVTAKIDDKTDFSYSCGVDIKDLYMDPKNAMKSQGFRIDLTL